MSTASLDLTAQGMISGLRMSPVLVRAMADVDHRINVTFRAQLRRKRLPMLAEFKAHPSLFFANAGIVAHRKVLTTGEAVDALAGRIAEIEASIIRDRFSWIEVLNRRRATIIHCRESMLFARYFRRFGARVWAVQAEAA